MLLPPSEPVENDLLKSLYEICPIKVEFALSFSVCLFLRSSYLVAKQMFGYQYSLQSSLWGFRLAVCAWEFWSNSVLDLSANELGPKNVLNKMEGHDEARGFFKFFLMRPKPFDAHGSTCIEQVRTQLCPELCL